MTYDPIADCRSPAERTDEELALSVRAELAAGNEADAVTYLIALERRLAGEEPARC